MKKWHPLLIFLLCFQLLGAQNSGIQLLGRYDHDLPAGGLVEIIAVYDSASQRLFSNLEKDKITIIDFSDPAAPIFIAYQPSAQNDVGPEASVFIKAEQSPTGKALLVVSNEESSTIAIYEFETNIAVQYIEEKKLISVYPNPFTTSVTVTTQDQQTISEIKIYNISGQLLYEYDNLNSSTIVIKRNNLPSGIFYLEVIGDGKIIGRQKIVLL